MLAVVFEGSSPVSRSKSPKRRFGGRRLLNVRRLWRRLRSSHPSLRSGYLGIMETTVFLNQSSWALKVEFASA